MIDHVFLNVSDYDRSKPFYEQALAAKAVASGSKGSRSSGFANTSP